MTIEDLAVQIEEATQTNKRLMTNERFRWSLYRSRYKYDNVIDEVRGKEFRGGKDTHSLECLFKWGTTPGKVSVIVGN